LLNVSGRPRTTAPFAANIICFWNGRNGRRIMLPWHGKQCGLPCVMFAATGGYRRWKTRHYAPVSPPDNALEQGGVDDRTKAAKKKAWQSSCSIRGRAASRNPKSEA
jgi:hypothetical protein